MRRVVAARADVSESDADALLSSLRKLHPKLVVQLVATKRTIDAGTLEMIGEQTLRAARTGALLAEKPEVDLLLRLAGTAQIAVAIERVGYRSRGPKLLVAAGPPGEVLGMRKALEKDGRFEILKSEVVTKEGLAMVEEAALLGARS